MECNYAMMKELSELEFSKKLRKASKIILRGQKYVEISEGNFVYYQQQGKKA